MAGEMQQYLQSLSGSGLGHMACRVPCKTVSCRSLCLTDIYVAHFRLCLNGAQVTSKCQMQESKEPSLSSFYILFQIRTRGSSLFNK